MYISEFLIKTSSEKRKKQLERVLNFHTRRHFAHILFFIIYLLANTSWQIIFMRSK